MSIKEKAGTWGHALAVWGPIVAVLGGLAGVFYLFENKNGIRSTIENEYKANTTPLRQLNISTRKVNAFNSDSASKKEVDSLVRKSNELIEYTSGMKVSEKWLEAGPILSAASYLSQTANSKAAFKVDSAFNAEMKAKREQFMRQTRANKLNKHIQQGRIRQQARIRMF